MSRYSISKKLNEAFEPAVVKARAALESGGFYVTSELDMSGDLRRSLEKDFRGYRILSANNAELAYKALVVETEIGLLLPCHVIVYENDEGGSTVASIDPSVEMSIIEKPALAIVAKEMRERLERIISGIS